MTLNPADLLEVSQGVPPRRRRRGPIVVIVAGIVLIILIAAAVVPSLFTSIDPLATATSQSHRPPSLQHLFGTDRLGRDVFSRVVHGAGLSLSYGFSATLIAVSVAVVIGMASGLGPRAFDFVVQRALEIALAFPELLVALVVIVILGRGTSNVIVAVAVAAIPIYSRIVRITTLQVRGSPFVESSTVLGQPRPVVIVGHILPNVVGPLLVLATIGVGTAIIAGSSLSFLGLGAAAPTPEWGLMLADGRNELGTAWWIAVFPGLAITLTVISTTVIGRWLQARFEGRTQ
jgi:peptide/nickel transport system permease protein